MYGLLVFTEKIVFESGTVNYVFELLTNDYLELYWSTTNTSIHIEYVPSSSPTPATPSIITTIIPVNQTIQGTQGIQGNTGAQGTVGTSGTSGTNGAQGTQGIQGAIGSQGAVGSQGTQGTNGSQGATGAQGTQGTQGIQGPLPSAGAMNYATTLATKINVPNGSTYPYTIASVSITTTGNPVMITATGDAENQSAGAWGRMQLYRGTTAIGNDIQYEGSGASENSTYALHAVDAPSAGTYTYNLKVTTQSGGGFNYGENTGPVITAVELTGKTGTQGTQGVQGTQGPQGTQGIQGTQGNTGATGVQGTNSGIVYKASYPNSKNATGTLGEICIDGTNGVLYICTGTNTWQKVSLNSANFTNTGGFN